MLQLLRNWFRGARTRRCPVRQSGSFRPALEGLEDRQLLSANLPVSGHLAGAAVGATTTAVVTNPVLIKLPIVHGPVFYPPFEVVTPLNGQGQGTYVSPFRVPDLGREVDLQGTVNLKGFGQMTVHGSIHGVGFISSGQAGGTLTLTNAHGSLTLRLTGPVQPGFSALPTTFKYQVISGTGSYQHDTDSGSLHLSLTPTAAGHTPSGQGTFQLTITSNHPVIHPLFS